MCAKSAASKPAGVTAPAVTTTTTTTTGTPAAAPAAPAKRTTKKKDKTKSTTGTPPAAIDTTASTSAAPAKRVNKSLFWGGVGIIVVLVVLLVFLRGRKADEPVSASVESPLSKNSARLDVVEADLAKMKKSQKGFVTKKGLQKAVDNAVAPVKKVAEETKGDVQAVGGAIEALSKTVDNDRANAATKFGEIIATANNDRIIARRDLETQQIHMETELSKRMFELTNKLGQKQEQPPPPPNPLIPATDPTLREPPTRVPDLFQSGAVGPKSSRFTSVGVPVGVQHKVDKDKVANGAFAIKKGIPGIYVRYRFGAFGNWSEWVPVEANPLPGQPMFVMPDTATHAEFKSYTTPFEVGYDTTRY